MIQSLNSLRGIFILFIFFHHCRQIYPGGGTMAVAFFFVLGGFSMTLGYKDKVAKSDFNYKLYLIGRCIKFYPLHWLCTLAVVLLCIRHLNLSDLPVLFLNATLLHSWIPVPEVYFSFNWVSWYLADTVFFTAVFPLILKGITAASHKVKWLIMSTMLTAYIAVSISISEDYYHAILYISPYMRLADFVFGIFLALLYLHLQRKQTVPKNNAINQMLIAALVVVLVAESCLLPDKATSIAPLYWLPISALILTAALSEHDGKRSFLKSPLLQQLGKSSFSFFMVHQIVLRYTETILSKISNQENSALFIISTLATTIILSMVLDTYFVKTITHKLKHKLTGNSCFT